jgi:hypothetical protein
MDILLNTLHYKPLFLEETYSDCYIFMFNEETDVQNLFVNQFAVDFEGTRNTVKQTSTFAASHFIRFLLHTRSDNNKKEPLCYAVLIYTNYRQSLGPGSVVVIATGYGLDVLWIESHWGVRFSTPVQTGPGAHPASCRMGTGSFPGVMSSWGVTLTPHPLLVPWSRKSRAIPLLPLWAVRPVQSLSACTRVTFTLPFTDSYLCHHQKPLCCTVLTFTMYNQFMPFK